MIFENRNGKKVEGDHLNSNSTKDSGSNHAANGKKVRPARRRLKGLLA